MVKKLRKEHRIITYLNQTNDQLSTRYVLVFSSIILRVSPINVIDANKYELFPPCNILFYTLLLRSLCKSSIQKVTVCNILFDTLLLRCLCKSFDTEGHPYATLCYVFLLYFPSTCPHLHEFDIPGIDCKRENACLQNVLRNSSLSE